LALQALVAQDFLAPASMVDLAAALGAASAIVSAWDWLRDTVATQP
jgi:hypothetical protein